MRPITRRIAALTVALALVIPTAALATDVPETLSVNTILSMAGIPASINYGAINAGTDSAVQSFTITATANTAGWRIDTTGTDFAGPAALSKNARLVKFSNVADCSIGPGGGSFQAYDGAWSGDGTPDLEGTVSGAQCGIQLKVHIPGGQAPGAYSGTVTFVMAAN